MVSEAIAKGDVQAINYFVAQKYIEALGQIASANNQKVVLMPLDSSSVIGALAGIGEIARETFGNGNGNNGGNSPARPQPRSVPRAPAIPVPPRAPEDGDTR